MSLRQRLAAINALAILVAVALFAALSITIGERVTLSEIDGELVRRAEAGPGPPGLRGPQFPQPPRRPGVARRLAEEEARRLFDVRRPRVYAPDGQALDPNEGPAWDLEAVRSASTGETVIRTLERDDERLRVLWTQAGRDPDVIVQVATNIDFVYDVRGRQILVALWLSPLAIALAAFGGWALAARALSPVLAATKAAERINDGEMNERLEVRGDAELRQLASAFNQMVTRLQKAFGARDEAYGKLEAAYEASKRFTGDASHELRTPLTRIKLAAEEGRTPEATEQDLREALEVIDQSADAMNHLVQQLLALARLESERESLAHERVELNSLAQSVAADLAPMHRAIKVEGVQAVVSGDPTALRSVLTNLLTNAFRHTPTGQVGIRVGREGPSVRLEVWDEGEGIPADDIPLLFDRFYRADKARARKSGGTGLGLAIVKALVEAHQGSVNVSSEVGVGTSVVVRLPSAK